MKKPKQTIPQQKQNINIYEQAEEAEGLNEFVIGEKKSPPKENNNLYNISSNNDKEPDLNDILGLNKKKNKGGDDFSDLVGGGGGANKGNKKKNDFFGDMDI